MVLPRRLPHPLPVCFIGLSVCSLARGGLEGSHAETVMSRSHVYFFIYQAELALAPAEWIVYVFELNTSLYTIPQEKHH